MPLKKSEPTPETAECILKLGKNNNVVAWREAMQTEITKLYGMTGTFLTTNTRYVPPMPRDVDYAPQMPEPLPGEAAHPPLTAVIIGKLRENAFEGRRREMAKQRADERTIWPMMWCKMSAASQSKVREDPQFEDAYLNLDCIRLWDFIRRSHLTHVFGDADPMREVNIQDQEQRYSALRQGEKEYITTFKLRFDNQLKAMQGAGIADVTETKRALEFISKLDTRRYGRMMSQMRNDALRSVADAYPPTLAAAFRIASGWTNTEPARNTDPDNTAGTAFVTKVSSPPPPAAQAIRQKGPRIPKKSPTSGLKCYVCGETGHIARNCERRADITTQSALVVNQDDENDDENEDWQPVYLTSVHERVLFTNFDVLLDNEASISIFRNKDLLGKITDATTPITIKGVQASAAGILVSKEATFRDLGKVYYSENTSANILSFASQIDAGAHITYNQTNDYFSLTPANGSRCYEFKRKPSGQSTGKFYCCDIRDLPSMPREHALVQTADENQTSLNKRETIKAAEARDMLARFAFPPSSAAAQIVATGRNFRLSEKDFAAADLLWGPSVASIKGKSTRKTPPAPVPTLKAPSNQNQPQTLCVDIMFVDRIPILVAVAYPLDLTLASGLTMDGSASRSTAAVRDGITSFISTLRSQNYETALIMSDGEGAIGRLTKELNQLGIEMDITGAGGHVARIERRIRTIKERVRSFVSHHLPFPLSTIGLTMLVLFCVSRLNFQCTSSRPHGPSPRQAFTGRPTDAALDFRCSFGDYVQATTPITNNSLAARTDDCITLLPTGNRTGSVKMLSLATGKIITRDHFQILPIPSSAIARLNALARADNRGLDEAARLTSRFTHHSAQTISPSPDIGGAVGASTVGASPTSDPTATDAADAADTRGVDADIRDDDAADDADIRGDDVADAADITGADIRGDDAADSTDIRGADAADAPDMRGDGNFTEDPVGDNDAESDAIWGATGDGSDTTGAVTAHDSNVDTAPATNTDAMDNEVPTSPRSDTYPGDQDDNTDTAPSENSDSSGDPAYKRRRRLIDIFRHGSDDMVFKVSVRDALRERGDDARSVINQELMQMITKRVWTPVHEDTLGIQDKQRIIRSSMFIREKFSATGSFEKLKARLVAGGNMQDKTLYEDLAAPTVATGSVFAVLSITAAENRNIAVVDIGGAFLNASMDTGVSVHMRLDATMTRMLTEMEPSYRTYVDHRGSLVVRLDKALYGCVESAALWYEHLSQTLRQMGYTPNTYDTCVYNKTVDGIQCTVAVHVDDLLITCKSIEMITALTEGMRTKYGEVKAVNGPIVDYLGMTMDASKSGEVDVTMTGYIDDMLKAAPEGKPARTPALDSLFDVHDTDSLCNEATRKEFHRNVARALYLAKRARPDCLTAVSFLATRVQKCTSADLVKLDRLLRYIRSTKDRGLVLRPGRDYTTVSVYIDAAYGVHSDGKSHTGSCVVLGESATIHCKSSKQGIVTKSSTEAELVALSDSCNQGIHVRRFMSGQGYRVGPLRVMQDNMSCMALVKRGRSAAEKTRHIDIRYFWVKERVQRGEAVIEHMPTELMFANVLTKPLQGSQFVRERDMLTGWASGEDSA